MEVFKEIKPLKAYLNDQRLQGNSVGLVPTMGALHQGHISLIQASKLQNQITICSIYVNPAQFNNPDDLLKYPRTLEKDNELLKQIGCDAVFCPDNNEMYPEPSIINIDFGSLGTVMEGKFRPGHFSGVALVLSKFFHIIKPDHAYFGQKDWQQFAIVQKLVDELMFDLTLHRVETLREKDGLAMSSRNQRLNAVEREKAVVFYQSLIMAKGALQAGYEIKDVIEIITKDFNRQGVRLEYFEVVDSKNLNVLNSVKGGVNQPIMCIAGYVGEVRLIDNMFLD
ncbi:MAG TPA: pantoate--beta-alanine ligase [Cyclobacteriaceae bacterium]